MSRGGWANDLLKGQAAEAVVAQLCVDEGWAVFDGPHTHVYDRLVINHRRAHLVEVKDESNYADSPNICIELYAGADRHPSGISISEASLTIHLFGDRWALYRTQPMRLWLRKAIKDGKIAPPRMFGDGDNAVSGVLIPRSVLMWNRWYDQQPFELLVRSTLWTDEGRTDRESAL